MDYLSIVYSRDKKPKTKYPSKLAYYLFKKFIKDSNKKFLEIGCGNCDLLSEFKSIGLEVTGTDLLKSAGKDYHDINIIQNNIEKQPLPFPDETFDCIFSKSVVEHIYNPQSYFTEAKRVLKKNGVLITLTPDWEVQKNKFFDDWTHKTPFSKVTMERLYYLSEFRSIEINYFKQLPILWENKTLNFLSNLLAPLIMEREESKLRWIRERQILGVGFK